MHDSSGPDDPSEPADLNSIIELALDHLRNIFLARERYEELLEKFEFYLLRQRERLLHSNVPSVRAHALLPFPAGVRRLRISRNPNGSGFIEIDNEKAFRLSCGLTDFLEYLASDDGGDSGDPLVSWKSRAAIRACFEKRTGRTLTAGIVNKRVRDLRKALDAAGIKRKLILTNNAKGVRFALVRGRLSLLVRTRLSGAGGD